MTQNVPPSTEGQIQAPNALELFWERNRRKVNFLLFLLILAILGNYAWKFWKQKQIDAKWGGFAATSSLDKGYTTDGSAAQFLDNPNEYMRGFYYNLTRGELMTSLVDQVKGVSKTDLDAKIAASRGSEIEPLLHWIGAQRAFANDDFAGARQHLKELSDRYSTHFLCMTSPYPVQWRRDLNADKEKPKDPASKPTKPEKPNLAQAQQGSLVASMLAQMDRIEEFRKNNASFFQVPEPDAAPTCVVKTTVGEFKIRLYAKLAPETCKNFLKRIEEGFYNGMYVDQIKRPASKGILGGSTPQELRFGLASAKRDDRSTWNASEPSTVKLNWEENNLSHFPGMVAAEAETDRKQVSGDRVWINATDGAPLDGDRVIFGKVVEGLDIVKLITQEQFSTLDEGRQGVGKPQRNIQIESITIVR